MAMRPGRDGTRRARRPGGFAAAVLAAVAAAGAGVPGAGGTAQEPPAPAGAPRLQEISLERAIREALEGNADLRVARSEAEIAGAETRAATARLLPRVDVRAGYLRSVDPVAAFGTKLRQGSFGQADLAVDRLNDPAPIDDWSNAVDGHWSPLDPTLWAGRSAARRRAEASEWGRERTREATVFETRALYYRAAGTEAGVTAAEASEEAARATFALFRRRHEEGALTRADLLQAEAELRAAEAETAGAVRARDEAREELGLHLGWDPGVVPVPSDTLAPVEAPPPASSEPGARSDLRALEALREAAEAEVDRATLAFVPALDLFGQYATHAPDAFGADGTDWTVGVGVRWNVFSGLGRFADRERAARGREIARTRYEHALRTARVEAERARREAGTARRRMVAMVAARAAAEEGRELLGRRFEEGMATAADLLQAQARAALMRARAVESVAAYDIAVARVEFVTARTESEVDR